MHRLFVAIDLPQTVKHELTTLGCDLPGARRVRDEQLHLTLRFIGEVNDEIFQKIREKLAEIKSTAFTVRLVGLGVFPPRRQPHVLWVGIDPSDPITTLRDRVESTIVQLGLPPEERKFSPHITLARLKNTPINEVNRYLAGHDLFASSPFAVNTFALYSSVLSNKGATHQLEADYPLVPPN